MFHQAKNCSSSLLSAATTVAGRTTTDELVNCQRKLILNMLRLRGKQISLATQHWQQTRLVATTSTSKLRSQNVAAVQRHETRFKNDNDQQQQQQHQTSNVPDTNNQQQKYKTRLDHLQLWNSVDTIKRVGHRLTQLDPLNLTKPERLQDVAWNYELIESMRANSNIVPTHGFLDTRQPLMAVNELLDTVWDIYANGDCGLEFAHMQNQHEIDWLTGQWEKLNEISHLDSSQQYNYAKLLLECEAFDHFMAAKHPTTKRYGCEGAESMLIVFDETLRLCHLGDSELDELTRPIGRIDDVIIGMPHRGRLNLLACLLGFEPAAIFNRVRGQPELDLNKAWMAKGDVLSHLSTNARFVYGLDKQHIGLSRDTPDPINVTLLPNPSHLEVVAPVTVGAARGRAHNILHGYSSSPKFVTFDAKLQDGQQDGGSGSGGVKKEFANKFDHDEYTKFFPTILPIQVHGDASIAGQGIIQETLQMANVPAFAVGGSLHLVVNNQIGYTTDGRAGRSSRHCSDVFKIIEAPIVHVNAQNIPSVVRATRLALAYRQKFGKDVAINLVCYRQHGHNEMDEPAFTQPQMYSAIRQRKTIPHQYCDEIQMQHEQRERIVNTYKQQLQEAYKLAADGKFKPDNDNYRNFELPTEYHRDHVCTWETGCDIEMLRSIALDSVKVPQNFAVHPNVKRVLIQDREQKFANNNNNNNSELEHVKVDWATAEILAFGSLLKQNHSVRLAGEDVARGTFSTRHAVLYDQNNGQSYVPLNNLNPKDTSDLQAKSNSSAKTTKWAQLEVANTILSEEAALAYEFGYSTETCELTLWEAQFGDFFNTAQSVIDTLIGSSETKWLKQTPLTMLLPHGLDGAGPEHSSAHLERFLQMSSSAIDSIDTDAKVNWSICYPTLPSQYFHLLRRQVLRPFRKPLVIMSPKTIFRHPACQSELGSFKPGNSFEPVLDDPTINDQNRNHIDTIVLCTGKVYFMLNELKQKHQITNVALVRIEELCPFPIQSIAHTLKQYPNVDARDGYIWFQEEHKNQGAYSFVNARLSGIANIKTQYIGRPESELPATGSNLLHNKELEQLVKQFQSLKSHP